MALLIGAFIGPESQAENFSLDDPFTAKLSAPMTSIMDGRSFRDGIHRLADASDINVWISRRVDPSVTINAGQLGPTVFAAMNKVAAANGCVIMPVENVLLVGPETWVDQVTSAIWDAAIWDAGSQKRSEQRNGDWDRLIDLKWDDLTTPAEALAMVTNESLQLPHDLWPATDLSAIKVPVAERLIRGQFSDGVKPPVKRYRHRYKSKRKSFTVNGPVAQHRSSIEKWFLDVKPKVSSNDQTFSLKTKVVAGAVITQLAQTAGLKCEIDESAMQACQKEIELEAKDKTLKQLLKMACEKAGVVGSVEGEVFRVQGAE